MARRGLRPTRRGRQASRLGRLRLLALVALSGGSQAAVMAAGHAPRDAAHVPAIQAAARPARQHSAPGSGEPAPAASAGLQPAASAAAAPGPTLDPWHPLLQSAAGGGGDTGAGPIASPPRPRKAAFASQAAPTARTDGWRAPILQAQARPERSRPLPPPSRDLLRSLESLERDLERLDRSLRPPPEPQRAPANAALLAELTAPPPQALPESTTALTIQRRVRLSLPEALAVAVRNDPELAAEVRTVRERRDLANAARGRWWPELALQLGGGLNGRRSYNAVWDGNTGLYPAGSPFLVRPDGWNLLQTNAGFAATGLTLNWELVSPERGATIAEADLELRAAGQRYGNRLRQLQLSTSEAYYGLQLADQLQRIRLAVLERDAVVRDQVAALKRSGLVPRLDLLRAEADLQQSRYRLSQAEALQLSRRRQLSNRLNVPFDITLEAAAAVVLQPPWPLDLEQTLLRGFEANPQLQALQAARQALLRQADRRAAQLLPTLRLVAGAGYGETITAKPLIRLEGCCAATNIRQLYNQSADWAAGLQLHWRVFDGGVTAGAVAASRSAAARTAEHQARERNAIRQRLEEAFFDHRAALEQIVATRASYAAAREAFRDVRARYQLGLSDYSDVADTISTLTTAMEGVAEATTLANVSYAQLLRELLPVPDQPGAPVSLPLVLEVGEGNGGAGSPAVPQIR